MASDQLDDIRQSFARFFGEGNIQLPESIPARGEIRQGGWTIVYVLDRDDDGQACLEFIANNRFTNSQHMRISSDGRREPLPSWEDDFSFDPNIPGDREASEARMNAHNASVVDELRRKGLIE